MSTNKVKQEKAYNLSDLINYYELCNRAEDRNPKTITWYTSNLSRFHSYLKSKHLPDSIEYADTKLLREYVLYLINKNRFSDHPHTPAKAEPLLPATIHGHVRTIHAFFSWLLRERLIEANPARDLKPPKISKKVISTLSDEEIISILKTFNLTNPSEARNQTIFMLLLDTGLRIGELVNLKMEDVHMNEGYLKVLGKGQKERIVPIGCSAQRTLQRYLFRYRPKPANPEINRVFFSIHGYHLT